MATSSECHRVKPHCRVYKNMKKSGNCTKNGSPGVVVKVQHRPKSACSRARAASSIAKAYRAHKQRRRSSSKKSGKKKKKKKKSIHELLQMTKSSYALKQHSKKHSKKHYPAISGGKGGYLLVD